MDNVHRPKAIDVVALDEGFPPVGHSDGACNELGMSALDRNGDRGPSDEKVRPVDNARDGAVLDRPADLGLWIRGGGRECPIWHSTVILGECQDSPGRQCVGGPPKLEHGRSGGRSPDGRRRQIRLRWDRECAAVGHDDLTADERSCGLGRADHGCDSWPALPDTDRDRDRQSIGHAAAHLCQWPVTDSRYATGQCACHPVPPARRSMPRGDTPLNGLGPAIDARRGNRLWLDV